MRIITAAFVIIFSVVARAELVPLPPGLSDLDDLFNVFHVILKQKVTDLSRNYYDILDPHGITFRSDSVVTCTGHGSANPGEDIARIDYQTKLRSVSGSSELQETVRYRSCHDESAFSEIVVTTGKDLVVPKITEIRSGLRSLSLAPNENSRQYIVLDHLDRLIFQVSVQKTPTGEDALFQLSGSTALYYRESFGEKRSDVTFQVKPFKFHFGGLAKTIDSSVNGVDINMIASASEESCCLFLIGDPTPRSPKNFFSDFSTFVVGSGFALDTIARTVTALTKELPSTQIISSGVQSGRMLDELNVAVSQLTPGALQVDQVKALILRYIDAFKNGQIIDNRPVVSK